MARFYLLYEEEGKLKFYNKQDFNDISEIDLLTIDYSKKEFAEMVKYKYQIDLKDKKLLIAKINLNKDNYNISIYNPIFQPDKKINIQKYLKIKYVMLNRFDKVMNKEKIKLLDDSSKFHSLINNFCLEIVNDNDLKRKMADSKSSHINLKLKEEILALSGYDYKFHVKNIWKKLRNYMDFRSFLLEYIDYYRNDLKQELNIAENYLFPSEIFNYNYSFFINPYEANKDKNKTIDKKYLEEDIDITLKLIKIKNSPFDDEEIGQVFKKYGINEVMNNFDANRIYSSTLKDLLRLGIINDEDYLNKIKELNFKI